MAKEALPLQEDIRHDGKIARLVKRPRKPYDCRDCLLPTKAGEPHYTVTWAGSGLGSIKFPARVCAGCIYHHMGIGRNSEDRRHDWHVLADWCLRNREELEASGSMEGLVNCLQRIWRDSDSISKEA